MYCSSTDDDRHSFVWMVKNSIVPRPIAWVSTTSRTGVHNLAPFSYFAPMTMDPPTVVFSVTGQADTLENVRAEKQFAINMALSGQERLVAITAATVDGDVDEALHVGLDWEPGVQINVPHLAGGGPSLECRLLMLQDFNGATLVFGEVIGVVVADELLRADGRIDQDVYHPLGRMGGSTYTRVNNWSRHLIPSPDEFAAHKNHCGQT